MTGEIISSKELGANCWLPQRITGGQRCDRVYTCAYPERNLCKAVDAEIQHLHQKQSSLITTHSNIQVTIDRLLKAVPAQAPRCPGCNDELIINVYNGGRIYWDKNEGWGYVQEESLFYTCSCCDQEFSGKDLDELGVPENERG